MDARLALTIEGHNRTQAAFRSVVEEARRAGTAVRGTGTEMVRSMQGANLQTGNLAAQFNDIAVQLANPGTSPFMIAIQQGTQIGQVLGPMGAGQAVKSLGTAFLSLLSPVNLITIGVIALGGELVRMLMSAKDSGESAAEALAKQAAPIESLKGRLTELQGIAKSYADAISATATAQNSATNSIIANSAREFDAKKQLLEIELARQDAAIAVQRAEMAKLQQDLRNSVGELTGYGAGMDLLNLTNSFSDPKIGQFVRAPWEDALLDRTETVLSQNAAIVTSLKEMGANLTLAELARDELGKGLALTFSDQVAASIATVGTNVAGVGESLAGAGMAAGVAADQMAAANSKASELADSIAGHLTTATSAWVNALIKGDDALQALRNSLAGIASQLLDGALSNLFGTITGSLFAPSPQGFIPGITGPSLIPSANGNVFSGPGIAAYSGSIVDTPTLFPFARGVGLMGEAGPEAILPLSRGADGKLGVRAGGGGGAMGVSIVVNNNAGVNVQAKANGLDAAGRLLVEIAVEEAERRVEGKMARGSYRGFGVGPGTRRS